jgi:hypothetical protein
MKAYIILNKGFEYNDEIYSEPESGGGTPKKVFFSKEEAKKEILRLNIQEMKETDIEQYTYDISDLVNDVDEFTKYVESLNTKYGKSIPKNSWDRPGEYALNNKATDEECIKYMKFVNLSFYELSETEVDQNDLVKTFRESKLNELL